MVPKHYAGIPKQVYYVSVLKYVPTGAYCSLIRGFCWTCSNPDGWFFHVNRRLSSPYHSPWLDGLRWPRGHRTTQCECFSFYWKLRIVIMPTLSSLVVTDVFVWQPSVTIKLASWQLAFFSFSVFVWFVTTDFTRVFRSYISGNVTKVYEYMLAQVPTKQSSRTWVNQFNDSSGDWWYNRDKT